MIHGLLRRSRNVLYYDRTTGELVKTDTQTYYYPLCNWGWDGSHDGYFMSGSFDALDGREYYVNGSTGDKSDCHEEHEGKFKYNLKTITQIRK